MPIAMPSKFSLRLILLPVAIVIHIVIMCGVGLILQSGAALDDKGANAEFQSELFLVAIQADQYFTKDDDGETSHGLPDPHDDNKLKDEFALYPGLYCSGDKSGKTYKVDYCTTWGTRFFDLQNSWKKYGVDLVKGKIIGTTPKLIFVGLIATAGASLLAIVSAFYAFASFWGTLFAAIFSWVATISAVTTTGMSHAFAHKLVKHITTMETTGTGKIRAEVGHDYIRNVWIGCFLPLIAAALLTYVTIKQRAERPKLNTAAFKLENIKKMQNPIPNLLNKVKGGFKGGFRGKSSSPNTGEYKQVVDETQGIAFMDLTPNPRPNRTDTMSTDMEYNAFYNRDGGLTRGLSRDTAYEPMRHR